MSHQIGFYLPCLHPKRANSVPILTDSLVSGVTTFLLMSKQKKEVTGLFPRDPAQNKLTEPTYFPLSGTKGKIPGPGGRLQSLAMFSGSPEVAPEKEGNTFLVHETQSQLFSVGLRGM